MRYSLPSLLTAITFAGIMLAASNCLAADVVLTAVDQQPAVLDVAGFGQAASDDLLSGESGGLATQIDKIFMQMNDVDMKAQMGDNVLDSNVTGNNLISYDAFSDMNGFATVIQNSGNQVIIQSDLIVNVNME